MNLDSEKKWLILSAMMVTLAALLLLLPGPREQGSYERAANIDGGSRGDLRVTEIIDGDTFILSDGSKVRLIGVDTPEKGQPLYDEAAFFADSILTGAVIAAEYDEEPYDDYGRHLVYLYADTILYNELVIERGLARLYLFPHNRKYESRLLEAQNVARRSKSGIWSLPDSSPEDYYVMVLGSYRFHRPLCPHLENARPENLRRIERWEDALDSGLSPCRFCRP